jgi:heptaprenyl diphosphate synthase
MRENMSRLEVYENIFSAKALFIAGLLIMPALLFIPSTEYRCFQFVFFCFLVLLSGKKINFLITFPIIMFIIVFNLIIPYGRVLFSFGVIKITSGALKAGVHRAFTLQSFVMLSRVAIRRDLKIPGAFGELLCESLHIFSSITNKKYSIPKNNVLVEIDNLMLELSGVTLSAPCEKIIKTKPAGFVILILVIIISWLPYYMFYL